MVNPDDILNRKFDKHRGGYRPEEVDEYMAEVASVISRLKRDAADQKRRYDALAAKMAQYESERSSVSDALLNAQKLSDNILRDARTKAETIEKDARGRADSLIGEIRGEITGEQDKLVGMKKEVSSFRSRLMEMYRTHLELINDIPTYHGEEDDSAAQPDSEPEQTQAEQPQHEQPQPEQVQPVQPQHEQVQPEQAQPAAQTADPQSAEPAAAEPVKRAEPAVSAAPTAPSAPTSKEEDYIDVMSTAFAAKKPEAAATDAKVETAPVQDKKPASGDTKAPELKLNVRFDEETGEYLPINEPKHYDFDAFSHK